MDEQLDREEDAGDDQRGQRVRDAALDEILHVEQALAGRRVEQAEREEQRRHGVGELQRDDRVVRQIQARQEMDDRPQREDHAREGDQERSLAVLRRRAQVADQRRGDDRDAQQSVADR